MGSYYFFPFTHRSAVQKQTLCSFFRQLHYLQIGPLKDPVPDDGKLNDQKMVHLFVPGLDLEKLDNKFKAYLEWVRIHRGNEHNLKALIKDSPYFKDDSHVSAIKAHLKPGKIDETVHPDAQKKPEKSALFLRMAQLNDEQNEKIDCELELIDQTKQQLISALRGLNSGDRHEDPVSTRYDPGSIMTKERIESWYSCMGKIPLFKQDESPILVTTSRAVMDYLSSICQTAINALDMNEIKVHENDCAQKEIWQDQLAAMLNLAVRNEKVEHGLLPAADDDCSLWGKIEVRLFIFDEIKEHVNLSKKQVTVCHVELSNKKLDFT